MITESLALFWTFSQSFAPNPTSVPNYSYAMRCTGESNSITASFRFENDDKVNLYRVKTIFNGYFLTNDPEKPITSSDYPTHDCNFYLDSVDFEIRGYAWVNDRLLGEVYSNLVVDTSFDIDVFYTYTGLQTLANSPLVFDFLDDDVYFRISYLGNVYSLSTGVTYGITLQDYSLSFSRYDYLESLIYWLDDIYDVEYSLGWQDGYAQGLTDGASQDATVVAIFSGILDIGLIPVNMFLTIFNFDILGINVSAFVSALVSAVLIFIMLRSIFSGGNSK